MISGEEKYKTRVQKLQKFKPLHTALAGGFLLLFSSGIYIGHGLFHWETVDAPWTRGATSTLISFAAASWYMGSIFGFTLTPMMVKFFTKKHIYIISNIFVALSAIGLTSLPENFYAVFFAKFVAGIGHGLAYVILVQHYGEICEDKIRGKIGTMLHLFMLKGGILAGSAIINLLLKFDFLMDPNRFFGIHSLAFSILAIVLVHLFYKESIVTLIQSGKDDTAIKTLMILRSEDQETQEITETFNEMKMMVAEDKHRKSGIFSEGNAKPLLIVTLLRVAYVLSFNYSLKYIHIYMTRHSSSGIDYTFILNLIHTTATVAVMFTIDKGRRKHFLLSACGTSAVLIIFGGIRSSIHANSDLLVFFMFVGFEFFSAIGLGLTSHIYSTEAFPIPKKTASIAFTSIIESCFQIVFIIWVENHIYSWIFDIILLFTTGGLLVPIIVYMFYNLPETKLVSLREARRKFL